MGVVHDLIVVPPARPLAGSVPAPPDDAIGTLALLCAAMAEGTSEVGRISETGDAAAMARALGDLGVAIEWDARKTARVRGVGLFGLGASDAPKGPIDCGGSARAMRLLAAVLAAYSRETVLSGDEAVLETDMADVVGVLRRRGAVIEGELTGVRPGRVIPPLRVGPLDPRRGLSGTEEDLAMGASEVKGALLLSGLFADEPTFVREGIASPDHAERMLDALDVPIEAAGPIVRLDVSDWPGKLGAFAADVPGDVSGAAILLAAATLVPASRVYARATGLNVTRRGTLDVIRQMGGAIAWEVHRMALGEPEGVACANHAPLVGIGLSGENLVRARRELHVVAALGARARGRTEMAGLGALLGPLAESTIGPLLALLRAFGVDAEKAGDGLVIEGRPEGPLIAADVEAGEPGLAVTATLLGLVAGGPSRVRDVDALARRFPRFAGTLRALGVDARIEERTV